MVPERNVDPVDLYDHERRAFVAFLESRSATDLTLTVAATPAWSVRDVLAHVVGITADLNAQHFGDGDGDRWTAAQIAARRGDSLEDLTREWNREAPPFEEGLRLFGYDFGAHYLGDLLQHVGDVHAALGLSPTRDDESIAVALDFYLASFEATLDDAVVGATDVHVGDESWRLGSGDVVASVTAERYEWFRALGGRRTEPEIRALDWTGDVDAVIGLVSRYPMPRQSLGEAGRGTT